MNHGIQRLFALCMLVVLPLAACQPKTKTIVPVTGVKETTLPAWLEKARGNVLDYVLASSRLAALPADADWQLEPSPGANGQYRFRSGDWLMLIRLVEAEGGNQQVVIFNQADDTSWSGYVTPDGQVVDTNYGR